MKTKLFFDIACLAFVAGVISGCCVTPTQSPMLYGLSMSVNQSLGTSNHPPQFYVCGNFNNPCTHPTSLWQSEKRQNKSAISSTMRKGKTHENYSK